MSVLVIVLKFWREAVIAVLVLGLVAACHSRDNAIRDKAQAEILAKQADAALSVITPKMLHVDTLLVVDTQRVVQTVTKLRTLRDTLLENVHDTTIVREFVTRADSAASACLELSNDCSAFRAYALQKFALDSVKLRAQPVAVQRSCVTPSVVTGMVGLAAGFLAGRR